MVFCHEIWYKNRVNKKRKKSFLSFLFTEFPCMQHIQNMIPLLCKALILRDKKRGVIIITLYKYLNFTIVINKEKDHYSEI